MPPRPPRVPRRESRSAHGPRRPRNRFGLWSATVVLATTLVVLVAMLVVRDQDGPVGTVAATDAEAVSRSVADDRSSGSTDDSGPTAGAANASAARNDREAVRKRPVRSAAGGKRDALKPTAANGLLCRPTPDRPALVRRRAGGTSKRVALTFDDGPSPKYTPRVLDILRKSDVPATFFVIGSQVRANRELTRRIVREGHALANHTWSHANVSKGDAAANTQLMDTQYAIQLAVGRAGCLMRPPQGAVGPGLETWLRKHKKVGVLWDVDSNDYQRPSAATMTRRIVSATRAGSIILLHDGGGDRAETVAAVPGIIKRLKAKGYELVTVPELLKLPRAKS